MPNPASRADSTHTGGPCSNATRIAYSRTYCDDFMEVMSAAMPTYDYSCRSCGARFEVWQKMSDEPLTTCPTCGGEIHRIVYPVGLVFKGSGFYSTDNRKSGSNGASSTPAASSTSTESQSESKPATKSEAKTEPAATKAAVNE